MKVVYNINPQLAGISVAMKTIAHNFPDAEIEPYSQTCLKVTIPQDQAIFLVDFLNLRADLTYTEEKING